MVGVGVGGRLRGGRPRPNREGELNEKACAGGGDRLRALRCDACGYPVLIFPDA